MKHSLFFILLRIVKYQSVGCFLARLAYFLYCVKFFLKKTFRKRKKSTMTTDEARRIIDEVYPQPESNPVYINPKIDENLDLSIVIPVYNYADILEDNIKSILNQKTDYKFEAIFVNDGSTDGAQDILRKYENHPNVKLIFQQNSGIGAARNTGINHANGKYLMFVDCDDIVHDDIVETLMSKAYEQDLDMVVAAHNLVKERNGEVYEVIPNIYPQKNLIGYKNGDEIMNLPGLPWGKVYKRELWNNVRFFPGYWYEDTIIQFLIFTQVKSYEYIPKVVYEYKWYEKNFSHTQGDGKRIKSIDSYWLVVEILKHYKEMNLPMDETLYTLLLRHLSAYLYTSVKGLDSNVIEALFVLSKDFLDKYDKEQIKLPYILRQTRKAFKTNDIELWKIASLYQ